LGFWGTPLIVWVTVCGLSASETFAKSSDSVGLAKNFLPKIQSVRTATKAKTELTLGGEKQEQQTATICGNSRSG